MASSTFDVARQVISWVNNVDPSMHFLEDDIMPLCVGPMKKILAHSMANFRNKNDISLTVKRRENKSNLLKLLERKRINKEKEILSQSTYDSLKIQRSLRISLNESIQQMRLAEGKKTSMHDEYDAYETRERIILDVDLNRNKELDLWTRTIQEINDVSQIQTVEAMILNLKKNCVDVLSSSSKSVRPNKGNQDTERNIFPVGDDTDSDKGKIYSDAISKGHTFHKQSDEELHKSVVTEYLAAARMSHSISAKLSERIIVPEENKEIFKNALAVELAYTEKSCLKKIISEVNQFYFIYYDIDDRYFDNGDLYLYINVYIASF